MMTLGTVAALSTSRFNPPHMWVERIVPTSNWN